MTELSAYTTLRLGGPARTLVVAGSEEELVAAVRDAEPPLLVLAGGSNVVVADEGFPGTVVLVATRGVTDDLRVAAGEPWDPFVADCVARGRAGVEALSGIPGSVGASPIQNIGAYGQEVAQTITLVRAYDREERAVVALTPAECGFGYRTSRFKREAGRWVVLTVDFALEPSDVSTPIAYAELARALGVAVGDRAPLADVRAAVLRLRRAKGMVVAEDDPDSVSAGSFFTNPVLTEAEFAALEERAGPDARVPRFPAGEPGRVKTSAAWLIERAGFAKGHGDPLTVAISSKHTLALTNRGAGTTLDLIRLAREVADGVEARWGVRLVPEPVFVGHDW